MTQEPLPPHDGVRVVTLSGEVDALTTQPLHEEATAHVSDEPLVLDLTSVTFFDSSGVRLVDRLARAHAPRFRVVAPPGGRPRRVLDIVGFGHGLVVDNLEQALDQLRG